MELTNGFVFELASASSHGEEVARFRAHALPRDAEPPGDAALLHVVRAPSGAVAGAGMVRIARLPKLGGVPLYDYSLALGPAITESALGRRIVAEAFRALAAAARSAPEHPIGMRFVVEPEVLRADDALCIWEELELVYAGKDDGGRTMRLAYFPGARIGGGAS